MQTGKKIISLTVGRVMASSLAWGGVMTMLRGMGFLLVMAYALRKIPAPEIGLWYVMLSIAGMGGIVEFGFSATLSRYASYYAGGAVEIPRLGVDQAVLGGMNKPAIAALVEMAGRLYRFFGVLVGGLMFAVWLGWLNWGAGGAGLAQVGVREVLAFLLLLAGTAFNMTGLYWGAILYGVNRVRLFNQWMVVGLIANYVISLAGLLSGFGILALVVGQVIGGLVPRLAARKCVRKMLETSRPGAGIMVSWRDLWPTTWRAGVLTLSTYLMINLTTFWCSVFTDLHTTASYGLTLQMALMLHTTSALWIWVKVPEIGVMRIQNNWKGILGLLRWRLPASLLTYGLGAMVVIIAAPWVLSLLQSKTEMLPRMGMVALFALIGLDLIVGHHSALLQTGNEVPHLRAFCISACLTLCLVWPLGRQFHLWGVIAAPCLAQVVVSYWWVPCQFWKRLHNGIRKQEGGV